MKYKLFVSANQSELRDERLAVKEVITNNATLRGFFDVFLFEDLPAKGLSAVSTYLRQVTNSDVYLCILGQKYGDKGKDGLSATEREFRAFRKAKPGGEVMAFIQGASAEDKSRDLGMQDFLKDVKASFIYKRVQNADALKTQVLNSLISFLDDKGEYSKGPFDKTVRKDLGYNAIDEKLVKDFLQNRAIKLKVAVPKGSIKKFLVDAVKVVKKEGARFYPTNTAILFFGKDPTGHISHHEIRIARFQGTSRVSMIDSKEIKGPVYSMLEEGETFFKRNTRLANKIVEFKRVDIPEYPFEAIREAIVNAIAHRDYTRTGSPIMIAIFDDRVEVSNPGGLLPQLDIKKLEGRHATRNEAICAIFHETMDMERFGTGIGKMKKLMKEHGLVSPEFSEEGDFFVVKFYGPGENILDLVPSIPEHRQTDLKKLGLNERQIEALRLMVNENKSITNKDYRETFKVTDRTALRDLSGLIKSGMILKKGFKKDAFYFAK